MYRVYPVTAGTTDADIQLVDRPASIRAQLMQGSKPLEQAGIECYAIDRTINRVEKAITDATGRAVFMGLGPGTWIIRTSWAPVNSRKLIAPVGDIALQAGEVRELATELGTIAVRGTLYEGDTMKPGSQVLIIYAADSELAVTAVVPDAKGEFEAVLPPGRYQIVGDSWEGGKSNDIRQDFTVVADAAGVNLTIRANSGPMLHGQLMDATGNPLSGLVVTEDGRAVVTGEDGRFSIAARPGPGDKVIGVAVDTKRVLARGFTVNAPKADDPDLRLVLEPMGEITGKAVDRSGRGLPGTGIDVIVSLDFGTSIEMDHWIWHTTMGEDGTFRVWPVPTGYRLEVQLRNRDQSTITQVALRGGEMRDLGEKILHGPIGTTYATVMAERTLRTDPTLVLPAREVWDATLTGQVLDESGKPVVGMRFHAMTTGGPLQQMRVAEDEEVISDLKGRFVMTGLPRNRGLRLMGNGIVGSGSYRWDVETGSGVVELRESEEAKAAATRP